MDGPIPPSKWPISARSPGKCILFGEHAVVRGRPELLLAIDLYTQVIGAPGPEARLDGSASAHRTHPYLGTALRRLSSPGEAPIDWTTISRLPRSAGLGSSAAFSASVSAVLLAAHGGADRSLLAERAFQVEREAQGVGSPGDTSASVAGGLIAVNGGDGPLLWELTDGEQRWRVRRVHDPSWAWLVAFSGVPRNTGETVRAVGARLARPDGPKLLDRFEEVARRGIAAVAAEDRVETGRQMVENQALLREVGVSHPRLEAMIDALGPLVDGVKLTGAGAGGSIVALPKPGREIEASRKMESIGAVPFVVRAAPQGTQIVDPSG